MAIDINTNPIDTTEFNDVESGINEVNIGANNDGSVISNAPNIPAGLTAEELNDPNNIKVTISDPNTPIVVLYGPPSCGKTMTLVRMTRYLLSQGYTVVPDKTFRPAYDANYRQLCESFNTMINSNDAATSTSNISFMLVKVLKNAKPICQLLEAPGEYYFNPDKPDEDYPAYVHEIIRSKNRKIWSVLVEPDWGRDNEDRANYVTRISNLRSDLSALDKVIFVYNKVDLDKGLVHRVGQIDTKQAINNVKNLYPNIFVPFKNSNPLTKWFKEYNCEFVPFMTGKYTKKMNGGLAYTSSHDAYPQKLWQAMLNLIKG